MSLDNFLYSSSAEDLDYPNIRPTLDLNFIRNQKVPPFVNVTRNSQTTYVDKFGILRTADINQPVFEWNPITGKCLGARIWGAVTNLFTYSSTFTDSVWSKNNVTITANSATSPAGATDASLVSPLNSGNLQRNFSQTCTTSTAGTYTFSIYVNRNTLTSSFIALRIRNQTATADVRSTWNTATLVFGIVGTLGGWTGSTSVQALPNGWFRLSISATTTASSHTSLRAEFWLGGYGNSPDTIPSPSIWGAQFQAGDIGPYVPTTTLAASSTADVWSITGADFSRIWNQSAATMYADVAMESAASANNQFIARASDNTYNNQISLGLISSGFPQLATASGGTFDGVAGSSTIITANAAFKLAAASQLNDLALSHSSSIFTDSSANTPTSLTRLDIGSDHLGFNRVVGMYLRRLTIYPKRLTDSQLKALTR